MRKFILKNTEYGKIPIVITPAMGSFDGFEGYYKFHGQILDEDNIMIFEMTEEKCIDELVKAFEIKMHFWVRANLAELHLEYEE